MFSLEGVYPVFWISLFKQVTTGDWLLDCFTPAGRHWRVSNQTATAAIVTATVTVTSCPSHLPLRENWEQPLPWCQEASVRSEITEGTASGRCCSTAKHSRAFRYGTCLARVRCPHWSKLETVLFNVLGNFKHSVGYTNTVSFTPLPAQASSCQAAAACLNSLAEVLEGISKRSAASWRLLSRYKSLTAWARPLLDLLHHKPAPDLIPFQLTLMNYLNMKLTLHVSTVSNAVLITCGVIPHPFWCFGTGFGL